LRYVVVGHLSMDLTEGGYILGGTSFYSSLTARRLGAEAFILSSFGDELDLSSIPDDIVISKVPSASTTTFQNIYDLSGRRRQRILGRASSLSPMDLPPEWRNPSILHLGPIAWEVEIDRRWREWNEGSLIGLTPQGWMRKASGKDVEWREWDGWMRAGEIAHVAIASIEDLAFRYDIAETYASNFRIFVLTTGSNGCVVFEGGSERKVPAFPANVVDPTGAGDVFAAAFLIRLLETEDPLESAIFANMAAAISLEGRGGTRIPYRDEVEERLRGFWSRPRMDYL